MKIGIAANDDSESLREEDQKTMDIALQAVYKGRSRGNFRSGKGPTWNTQRYAGGEHANRG